MTSFPCNYTTQKSISVCIHDTKIIFLSINNSCYLAGFIGKKETFYQLENSKRLDCNKGRNNSCKDAKHFLIIRLKKILLKRTGSKNKLLTIKLKEVIGWLSVGNARAVISRIFLSRYKPTLSLYRLAPPEIVLSEVHLIDHVGNLCLPKVLPI